MNMKRAAGTSAFTILVALLTIAIWAYAQTRRYPKAKVSFSDFRNLVAEVESHREERLVDFDKFLAMAKEPGTIVLDARSDFRFQRIHLKGARHLSFTDFTQDNLAKVIPAFETRILIYCNNNFDGNETDFPGKQAMPYVARAGGQMKSQGKPIMLALNVPTYINLYGYGYRNVYELDELVNVSDPRIAFEGTFVTPVAPSPAP
jgi:hypothetical protein